MKFFLILCFSDQYFITFSLGFYFQLCQIDSQLSSLAQPCPSLSMESYLLEREFRYQRQLTLSIGYVRMANHIE